MVSMVLAHGVTGRAANALAPDARRSAVAAACQRDCRGGDGACRDAPATGSAGVSLSIAKKLGSS